MRRSSGCSRDDRRRRLRDRRRLLGRRLLNREHAGRLSLGRATRAVALVRSQTARAQVAPAFSAIFAESWTVAWQYLFHAALQLHGTVWPGPHEIASKARARSGPSRAGHTRVRPIAGLSIEARTGTPVMRASSTCRQGLDRDPARLPSRCRTLCRHARQSGTRHVPRHDVERCPAAHAEPGAPTRAARGEARQESARRSRSKRSASIGNPRRRAMYPSAPRLAREIAQSKRSAVRR